MKLPRKLKKQYKKNGVPYTVSYKEFKQYLYRDHCLGKLYPDDYDHHIVFQQLRECLS
jgi:hypothetical protein